MRQNNLKLSGILFFIAAAAFLLSGAIGAGASNFVLGAASIAIGVALIRKSKKS